MRRTILPARVIEQPTMVSTPSILVYLGNEPNADDRYWKKGARA